MINVYTDGGCRGNHKESNIGGWGVLIGVMSKDDSSKLIRHIKLNGSVSNTTNNVMELTAVIKALESIGDTEDRIKIYSDSSYVVNGITEWIHGWIKKGWVSSTKKPVKNKELWQRLHTLISGKNVKFVWVKGHADNKGNIIADKLANEAMDNHAVVS